MTDENASSSDSGYARNLIEASLDPLVTISPEGKITDVNRATERVTGVSRDKLIDTDFADYFTEPEKAREGYREVFQEGQVVDYALAIRHVSGHVTDVLYNASVYRDESGKVIGVFAAARDVTERKRAEEQVRAASHYARSLLEASLDPLVTISPEGKITDVNRATEKATGVSRGDLVGTDFADYFTEPEKAREGYREVFQEGQVVDYPLAIRHTSGQITDVLYNASVYRDEAGKVIGVFAAARDVTQRNRAEEQVRNLNEDLLHRAAELESVNRELEAFNYSVSHDLRAPLRSLDGFSQVLLEDYGDSLDDEGRDYLDRIRRAATRMGRLIDDLLNLSRVTRVDLRSKRFDLSASAEEVADELRKTPEGARTSFEIAPGMRADGDEHLVSIALSNLMGNAVKFSAKQLAPKVEVGTTPAEGGPVYYVRDNGVGFDTSYSDKLFMPFQRLHSDREFAGTGIGLAMVQRIIHRHGGRIWAESELGSGSTFYFTLRG